MTRGRFGEFLGLPAIPFFSPSLFPFSVSLTFVFCRFLFFRPCHYGRAYGSRITRSLRYIRSECTGFRDDEGALWGVPRPSRHPLFFSFPFSFFRFFDVCFLSFSFFPPLSLWAYVWIPNN